MPSSSSSAAAATDTTAPPRRRRSASAAIIIADRLRVLDERLSRPVFFLGLPKWIELVFSLPANLFGTTFSLVVGPLWIALAALRTTGADACYTATGSGNHLRILLLKVLALAGTAVYAVAWAYGYQIRRRVGLGRKLFWKKTLYVYAYPWSVGVLRVTVGNLEPPPTTPGNLPGCENYDGVGRWAPGAILSVALYPLVLWPFVAYLMNLLKDATGRHRPARKDRDRGNSAATSRKSFPLMTELLAEHDGDRSFPSGDVMMATLLAIPLWTGLGLRGIPAAIVLSSALGRMYVLAHHLSDVTAGFGLVVAVHGLCGFAAVRFFGFPPEGGMIRGTAWWHPLLSIGLFVWAKKQRREAAVAVRNPRNRRAGVGKRNTIGTGRSPIYSSKDD